MAEPTIGGERAVRVLAVADTDSYLKWGAATLAAMPAGWVRDLVVIANPVMPSPGQIAAATDTPAPVLTRRALRQRLRATRPDVVLLAATGPVVSELLTERALRRPGRPVLLTGLPGISVPATTKAIRLRTGCDLFLLHSHREVDGFDALAAELGVRIEFGLARLPFLPPPDTAATPPSPTGPLVFAAQAKVPSGRPERVAVVRALAATGDAVIKVRALGSEQQTHHEAFPYPALVAELVADQTIPANAVSCRGGSMQTALTGARGLVTVSSTAVLEAIAAEVPVLVLDEFGVSGELINEVFEGSGCLGGLAELRAGRLRRPDPAWLHRNYFHPAADDDWTHRLSGLLERRRAATLPRPVRQPRRLSRRVRLLLPAPVTRALVRARARLRRIGGVGPR